MKRIMSLVLAAVLLLSCMGMITVSAEEEVTTLTTSDECVKLMKYYEGFSSFPYYDYGQWTVGYGTCCPSDKLEQYQKYGISKEEAEELFRSYLRAFENDIIEQIVKKNNVTLTQNQFDALVSFSYNCGSGWAHDPTSALYSAVVNGADTNEFIRSFALWCSAGGQILTYLIQRRLSEANMFLNGVYDRTPPENYCYVLYNANGGTSTPRSQGYDSTAGAAPYPVPTYEGYTFEGWYTERVGGEKITELTQDHNGSTFYAHWVDDEGNSSFVETGDVTVTVTAYDVNVRTGPGTFYSKVGTVTKGDKLVITETTTGGGYTWGRFSKGWIALMYTDYDQVILEKPDNTDPTEPEVTEPETTEPETTEPETTVPETTVPETTAPIEPEETEPTEPEQPEVPVVYGVINVNEFLRVRSGPGTGYSVVDMLKPKQRVQILEQKMVGSVNWGKIDKGWISMQYVILEKTESGNNTGSGNTESKPDAIVGTGTIVNCTRLRIRSGPSTNYTIVGYVDAGEKISFTEFKKSGSVTWGKYSKGWISLDYVKLDKVDSGNNNSGSDATTGTTVPNTGNDSGTSGTVTGTIIVNEWLRVRSGPGTTYSIAGYLQPNDKVIITEQKTVGAITWGKIEKGWISMQYVKLDKNENNNQNNSQTPAADERTITATSLYIRKNPGTGANSTILGFLTYGTKVTILEIQTVSGVQWGRISNGWICLSYTKK